MTYVEAILYLNSFLNYEQVVNYRYPEAFSLDRITRLLERLGDPHRRYPTLHVAGTKGKGSTCAFAASILQAAGVRVGLYTSPHLISFQERIQVNGRPIPEEDLVRVVETIRPFADHDLTYFEVTTACAFLYFALSRVEAAVIEVGLGGRLDATNVLTPAVTAITPISLDHMSKLGDTVERIALEKAGIIKPGIPLVMAAQEPAASGVIREAASAHGAPLHAVEQEVKVEAVRADRHGTRCVFQTPAGFYPDLFIPLLGRHQVMNAATAIRMVELFEAQRGQANGDSPAAGHSTTWGVPRRAVPTVKGARSSEATVRWGIAHTVWPGRCQYVDGSPGILLDGAQNAASAKALVETVRELFPGRRITLVLGMSLDKDPEGIARLFGPWADRIILTKADIPRAESPRRLAEIFRPWHPEPLILDPVSAAFDRAKMETPPNGLIVVSGSLFVVGEALQRFSPFDPSASSGLRANGPSCGAGASRTESLR